MRVCLLVLLLFDVCDKRITAIIVCLSRILSGSKLQGLGQHGISVADQLRRGGPRHVVVSPVS